MTTQPNATPPDSTREAPSVRHFGSSVYGGRPTFALTREEGADGGTMTLYELLPDEQADARRDRLERANRSVVIEPFEKALAADESPEKNRWEWDDWVALKITRLSSSRLRAVLPLLRETFSASDIDDSILGSTGSGEVYLPESVGVRLAVTFAGIKPIRRVDRMRAFARGVARMSDEECYYWFAKCRSPSSQNGAKALRVLLTDHI